MSEEQRVIRGITEQDFNLWRHHPVTKVFLQYAADKRAFFERSVLDQFIDGSITLQAEQTIRGQIIELFETENLPFAALEAFYSQEEFDADAAQIA